MKFYKNVFLIFLIIIFFLGLYLYSTGKLFSLIEGIESNTNCPDTLINNGNELLLFNSNMPTVEGTNPIRFSNLDSYVKYLEAQRKNGINCPVLYLQAENDVQGNDVLRMRPGPTDKDMGSIAIPLIGNSTQTDSRSPIKYIDSNRSNPPYNSGNYAGFDPHGLFIGKYTELDAIHDSTKNAVISDNPADPNWGGVAYTQYMVDTGKYDDYNIYKPQLITPKVSIIPDLYPNMQYPKDRLE
jgi:hypothetical protein